MYTVSAKESSFTLRPEGTAGTIRAILQNGLLNEALPQRVYYILSCFRHERPQAGRLREFHQFGVEMAGSPEPSADAEVISLAHTIISELGVKDVELHKKYIFITYLLSYLNIAGGGSGFDLTGKIKASNFIQRKGKTHSNETQVSRPVMKLPQSD